MGWLERLVMSGYNIEAVISSQPGFEMISLICPRDGRRILYWKRSGKITEQTVEHVKRLVNMKVDKLLIEFEDKPQIDPKAEQKLRQLIPEVEIRSRKELEKEKKEKLPDVVELYGGDIVIVKKKKTRGSLRLYESDRVHEVLNSLDSKTMWILVIELTKDGQVRIIDDYKHNWKAHVNRSIEEGSRVVILAVWHGKYSTDIFLLYPHLEEGEQNDDTTS